MLGASAPCFAIGAAWAPPMNRPHCTHPLQVFELIVLLCHILQREWARGGGGGGRGLQPSLRGGSCRDQLCPVPHSSPKPKQQPQSPPHHPHSYRALVPCSIPNALQQTQSYHNQPQSCRALNALQQPQTPTAAPDPHSSPTALQQPQTHAASPVPHSIPEAVEPHWPAAAPQPSRDPPPGHTWY